MLGGGTITNDPNFLNTGTLQIGDGSADTTTFSGGLRTNAVSGTTLGGTIADGGANQLTFGGVTLTAATTLDSQGGNIQFASIAGGSQDLSLNAGVAAGTTTVTGTVAALGDGLGAALTVDNAATGLVDFQGTFGANSGLVAGAATSVKFAGDVTLADGDTATNLAGAVTLDGLNWSGYDGLTTGALTLSTAAVDINSQGGNIQFASIAGGSQDLSLNAGVAAGTTTVTGTVAALGDGTGAALTVDNAATGLVDFQGTFGANSGLVAGAATSVKFAGDVTLGDGDTATNLAGAVTLDGLNWSGYDGLTTGALTLSTAAVDINSQGGNIQFASIAGGSQDLSLNAGVAAGTTTVTGTVAALGDGTGAALTVDNAATGLVDFQGTFGANSGLVAGAATSVKFAGDVTLGDGDTATNLAGAVTLDGLNWSGYDGLTTGALTLSTAAVDINSQGGNIQFASIAGGSQDLSLNAGVAAGTTTVTGTVAALGDGLGAALTVDNAATGLVDFQGTFGANSGLVAGAATSVKFAGDVTLGDGDTATNLAGAVTLDGLNWSGYDGLTTGALTLSTAAVDINSQGGNIQFASIAGGSQDLSLNAGVAAGTTTVTGTVAALGDGLGAALTVDNAATGLVDFQGTFGANSGLVAGAATSVKFAGDVTLADGDTATNLAGAVTLDGLNWSGYDGLTTGALTLSTAAVDINSQGGNIQFASIAGGSQDLSLNAGVAAGTTTVTGTVAALGDGLGAALTVDNAATGLVDFQGTFGANSGLVAGAATSVKFAGDVTLADGDTATNLAGAVTLDGLNWSGYDGLTTGALTLSTAAVDINSQGGNIQFASIAGGSQDLSLNAGVAAGTTTVTGTVAALGDGTGAALTVDNAATGLVDFQGTFGANSGLVAGAATSVKFAGDVTLGDGDTATNLAGAVTLDGLNWSGYDGLTTGALTLSTAAVDINSQGGNIDFDSTVDGAQSLTVNSGTGGTIAFDGNIGDAVPVTSITITQSGGTTFSGDVAAGTLTITDTADGQSVTFADAKDVDLTTGFTISNAGADNYNVVINSSTFDAAGDTNFLNGGTVTLGNDSTDVITFAGGLATTGNGTNPDYSKHCRHSTNRGCSNGLGCCDFGGSNHAQDRRKFSNRGCKTSTLAPLELLPTTT